MLLSKAQILIHAIKKKSHKFSPLYFCVASTSKFFFLSLDKKRSYFLRVKLLPPHDSNPLSNLRNDTESLWAIYFWLHRLSSTTQKTNEKQNNSFERVEFKYLFESIFDMFYCSTRTKLYVDRNKEKRVPDLILTLDFSVYLFLDYI